MAGEEKQAFFKAIQAGRVRTVCGYLNSGNVDINGLGLGGYTPLIQAVYVTKEEVRSHIVRMLVRHGSDVNLPDNEGKTALMHACLLKNRDDVIRRIISTGSCDPNLRDSTGKSALWHAASTGNNSAIRQLVNDARTKTQLEVDCENDEGLTPLAEAVAWGHAECVRILVNESGACTMAVRDNARLEYLLQESDFDDVNDEGPSRPLTSRSIGRSSLQLERISLHSRHSLFPPDVDNIQTDRSDPGEGCSDPVNGNITFHNHGLIKPSRISLELPILDPLPISHRVHHRDHGHESRRVGLHADDTSDDDISIISQYSLSPRGDGHNTERFNAFSPIVVGSPGGFMTSSITDLSSSLSLPRISDRSPSPGNPDRTPSYDFVNTSTVTSSYERSPREAPKKGGRRKSTDILTK